MNPKRWLYLINLIEMLQDRLESDRDSIITAEEVHDMMNDPDEDPTPVEEFC